MYGVRAQEGESCENMVRCVPRVYRFGSPSVTILAGAQAHLSVANETKVSVEHVSDNPAAGPADVPADRHERVPERPLSRALWAMATLLLIAGVALALLPEGFSLTQGAGLFTETVDPRALAYLDDLERQPIDSLPDNVMEYEVIALQAVPGVPQAAEAVYVPGDMKVSLATPIRLYANVEAFPTAAQAQGRASEILREHPASRRTELLGGVTPAEIGMTDTQSAWIAVWTRGQFCVYLKAFYDRPVPADGSAKEILDTHGLYVAHVVETFQRTGQKGAGAREMLEKAGLAPGVPAGGQ